MNNADGRIIRDGKCGYVQQNRQNHMQHVPTMMNNADGKTIQEEQVRP